MGQHPISKGYFVIVDDDDDDLASIRWTALEERTGCRVYATRVGAKTKDGSKRTCKWLHREIMARTGADLMGLDVDHINGDTLDNRRSNLRVVTRRENLRNAKPKANSTGYMGVTTAGNRFIARIRDDKGTRLSLGSFKTAEEANVARLDAEARIWGIQPRRESAFT